MKDKKIIPLDLKQEKLKITWDGDWSEEQCSGRRTASDRSKRDRENEREIATEAFIDTSVNLDS